MLTIVIAIHNRLKFTSPLLVPPWLWGRDLDWRLSQPGFDPSYGKLVCQATLMISDWTKQICMWVTIYIYVVPSIGFPTFFVPAFNITEDSWKFCMLLLYILWGCPTNVHDFRFKWTATAGNPDCHRWWISKMQSRREDTLEERYPIKLF